jgi:hypothetical protein
MENFNGIIGITHGELVPEFISKYNYDNYIRRNKIEVIRRACYGTPALVKFDSLPSLIKEQVIEKYGDPKQNAKRSGLAGSLERDGKAVEFYSMYKLYDGRMLPEDYQREYVANASVLNAMHKVLSETKGIRKSKQKPCRNLYWGNMTESVMLVQSAEYPHTLPSCEKRLKMKLKEYLENGYESLISGKFCNQNTRKVTAKIERLILSLYCMKNNPFGTDVHDKYHQFLGGAIDVVDVQTGEIIDRKDFIKEDGKSIVLSEATIWNYLNRPNNRAIVDKYRTGTLQYNNEHRPHYRRHSPLFAFSKISMDDRDLPRKLKNGIRVKAYYAYDVASGCVIGKSYSQSKDMGLVFECFRDMIRFIDEYGFGMPLEVEVEHHLMNEISDQLSEMFKFVHFCAPSNSQEKRAEHFNRTKKYSIEKSNHSGIGRWWAKSKAYRIDQPKMNTETNNEYKEKAYDYNEVVADDMNDVLQYNNDLHSNQKLYPGMSRMEVLKHNMNPDAPKINRAVLMHSIGNCTSTSITRSQAVKVQYQEYQLSHPNIIGRLLPNDYTVKAYWLPDSNDEIKEVYLYQDGKYLDTCTLITRYNEAQAERTEADETTRQNQAKYISSFDSMIKTDKAEKTTRVEIIKNNDYNKAVAVPVEIVETEPVPVENDYDSMIKYSGDGYYTERAIDSI